MRLGGRWLIGGASAAPWTSDGSGGGRRRAATARPDDPGRPVPDEPGAAVDPTLAGAHGPVAVVLQLTDPSLSASVADDAVAQGNLPAAGASVPMVAAATRQQDGVVAHAKAAGATEVARLTRSLNAVVVATDASAVPALAAIDGVTSVRPVGSYHRAPPRVPPASPARPVAQHLALVAPGEKRKPLVAFRTDEGKKPIAIHAAVTDEQFLHALRRACFSRDNAKGLRSFRRWPWETFTGTVSISDSQSLAGTSPAEEPQAL